MKNKSLKSNESKVANDEVIQEIVKLLNLTYKDNDDNKYAIVKGKKEEGKFVIYLYMLYFTRITFRST